MTSKKFWRTVKPFLTNNGCISTDFIGIENEGKLICSEHEIVELFNEHYYIYLVEKPSGKKPLSLGNPSDASQDEMKVKEIISIYSNHLSIRKIKNLCVPDSKFDLAPQRCDNVNHDVVTTSQRRCAS